MNIQFSFNGKRLKCYERYLKYKFYNEKVLNFTMTIIKS